AGETATFFPSSGASAERAAGVPVRMSAAAAEDWDGATVRLRFAPARGALARGATGALKLSSPLRRELVVRASAILRSPAGPYALVVSNDRHTLTRRPVVIGNVIYGYATILSGLHKDESVVARRTFFLDAERRRAVGAAL